LTTPQLLVGGAGVVLVLLLLVVGVALLGSGGRAANQGVDSPVEEPEAANEEAAQPISATAPSSASDYELTHSLFNANKDEACAEVGPYGDYEGGPLSGKLQTWYGCGPDGATTDALAAYPEGRECVVALTARVSEEADREAIEHLVDIVEVDCGRVTSGPLPASPSAAFSSSASASPSASREVSASAAVSASAEAQEGGCSNSAYKAQNPGVCGTSGYNPVSDPGDNYSQGVVVGDDTPDCARPEDVNGERLVCSVGLLGCRREAYLLSVTLTIYTRAPRSEPATNAVGHRRWRL
jgi:Na+-transporting methylmalonyl-CoA/oxaloacetate decarboxylase gamma subunit